MDDHMQNVPKKSRSFLIPAIMIVIAIVIIAVITGLWATRSFGVQGPRPAPPRFIRYDFQFFYTLETIISVVNTTLSIILLLMYINIYRKTQSQFTIGLIIFSVVLLLQAFVSLPLLHRAFGFYEFGLGPFVLLPDLFTCVALAVLLYLTFEY